MKVLIVKQGGSYLPEAYAYASHLKARGFTVVMSHEPDSLDGYDICIRFMGFQPFWGMSKSGCLIVHEYHSLSTPPYPRIKDILKATLNGRPSGRIFLNDIVRESTGISDDVPYLLRDMGVDAALFQQPAAEPIYDLIYCGSVSGRPGLLEEIYRLASLGLKIIVVGNVTDRQRRAFAGVERVKLAGPVSRERLPDYYRLASAGLNYTPNTYPFCIQTSTKTLEYCAAGLGVVSNRYAWATDFCERRGGEFLWLDELKSVDDFRNFRFRVPDVADLEWGALLDRVGLHRFLTMLRASI